MWVKCWGIKYIMRQERYLFIEGPAKGKSFSDHKERAVSQHYKAYY